MSSALRWGLLSTARINERVLPQLRRSPRSEVVAVASRDAARARAYAQQRGIPKAYGDYQDLCRDPAIDAVYVSLPNSLHAQWCVALASAGKHVLCEKPLALSEAEVDGIIASARACGVTIQEASAMRYHPQTSYIRTLVESGAIGQVRLALGWYSFTLRPQHDIRLDPGLGGGSLWDIGCYPITLLRAVLGLDPVEVVGWCSLGPTGVDLTFAGQVKYANGTLAQLAASMAAVPSWEAQFLGSEGLIRVSHPWLGRIGASAEVTVARAGEVREGDVFGSDTDHLSAEVRRFENVNAYAEEIAAFEAAVLDGQPPAFPLEESRANIRTIAALLTSAREGRPIST